MITIQFQALNNYQKQETDEKTITEVFEHLQQKYPRLFDKQEVIVDVTVNKNPHTLDKKVTAISFIPKHGKVISTASETTFNQAANVLKNDLDRTCRKLTEQR